MSHSVMSVPMKNESVPKLPKKCMGRLLNLCTKVIDSKSKKPNMKRSSPNLVLPYLRARCWTIFSPILPKPFHLATTGI